MCDVQELKLRVRCNTPEEPISVYIMRKRGKQTEQIGICKNCWDRIADKDWECGKFSRPTMEDLFSDKARFGDNPILTDYKVKSLKTEEITEDDEEY